MSVDGKWAGAPPDPEMLELAHRELGGTTVRSVPLRAGSDERWPAASAEHPIDAVNLPGRSGQADPIDFTDHDKFVSLVEGSAVNLVIARSEINRPLFGLLVGGRDLFCRSYPEHGTVSLVAAVRKVEPNVAWVFRRAGIRILRPNRSRHAR